MNTSGAIKAVAENVGEGESYRVVNGYLAQLDSGEQLEPDEMQQFADAISRMAEEFEKAELDEETMDMVITKSYEVIDHPNINKNSPAYPQVERDLNNLVAVLTHRRDGIREIARRSGGFRKDVERSSQAL